MANLDSINNPALKGTRVLYGYCYKNCGVLRLAERWGCVISLQFGVEDMLKDSFIVANREKYK